MAGLFGVKVGIPDRANRQEALGRIHAEQERYPVENGTGSAIFRQNISLELQLGKSAHQAIESHLVRRDRILGYGIGAWKRAHDRSPWWSEMVFASLDGS